MGHDEKPKITFALVVAVIISVMGSSFQYGYNIAVVNAPAKLIQEFFFGNNLKSPENVSLTTTQLPTAANVTYVNSTVNIEIIEPGLTDSETLLWSLTVAIYTVGGMIGSYSTGFCLSKLGRKGTLLASNALSIVGAVLMGTSKLANSLEMIIIARFLLGIFAGLATGVVPLYLGEISPKHIRGGLGVIYQLSITIGIVVAQLLSLNEVLGTAHLWPVLLAVTAIPSIFQLIILPFLPESPRCLLIDREREDLARQALEVFRGTPNVTAEVREMRQEAEAEAASGQMSALELLRDKTLHWQIMSIMLLQVAQQACGINAVFFYLNTILENAGVEESMQNYASVGVGTVNVILTVITAFIIDRTGRKVLLAGGFGIAGFFCLLMTVALNLQDGIPWMSYLSIACVIGFVIGFAIGPGPVPWILTAEFFTQSSRPAASAIGSGLNWTFNFIIALIFPFMQKGLGPFTFLVFLVVCVIATVYTFIVIPETKHKTFQEINRMFMKRNHIKEGGMELEDSQVML